MTTGRINQVTILCPQSGCPQKGAGCIRYHMAEGTQCCAPPAALLTGREAAPKQATDPIAPTECPEGWSATGVIRPFNRRTSPHTPSKEEAGNSRSRHFSCGYRPCRTPRDLLDSGGASYQQTSLMPAVWKQPVFRPPLQARARTQRPASTYRR